MANRMFSERRLSLEKEVVDLFAKVTIGATGDPTLVTASSKGVASITRTSAGLYVLTLSDKYRALLFFNCIPEVSSGIAASPALALAAETVATDKTITFQFTDLDGTPSAVDPAEGEVLRLQITLSNSSAY
jgi:hypothetical protein